MTTTTYGALQGRRLSELVEEKLTGMIRGGEVEEGEALPSERQLMDLFEVGRPSVREALFALQRKGLVRLRRGGAPIVTRPEPQHLLRELSDVALEFIEQKGGAGHFEQARLFIETSIVRFAADNADARSLALLDEALAANGDALGKPAKFVKTDVAFHRALAECTGNPVLLSMHDAMVEWVILRRPPVADPDAQHRRSYTEHKAILAAIRARDGAAAAAVMQEHLERARRIYRGKNQTEAE